MFGTPEDINFHKRQWRKFVNWKTVKKSDVVLSEFFITAFDPKDRDKPGMTKKVCQWASHFGGDPLTYQVRMPQGEVQMHCADCMNYFLVPKSMVMKVFAIRPGGSSSKCRQCKFSVSPPDDSVWGVDESKTAKRIEKMRDLDETDRHNMCMVHF